MKNLRQLRDAANLRAGWRAHRQLAGNIFDTGLSASLNLDTL
jgi:hypothetical protein